MRPGMVRVPSNRDVHHHPMEEDSEYQIFPQAFFALRSSSWGSRPKVLLRIKSCLRSSPAQTTRAPAAHPTPEPGEPT